MLITCMQQEFEKSLKKKLGQYHGLYVQSDTLLLPDVFENFRNMCLKTFELDPSKFISAAGLACQAALRNTKVKFDVLNDIDMFLMVKALEK